MNNSNRGGGTSLGYRRLCRGKVAIYSVAFGEVA